MRFFESQIRQRRDDPHDEERFWPRYKCKVATHLSDDEGNRWRCDIIDRSQGGFKVITNARLEEGKVVNIANPMMQAGVVWVRNNKAGLMIRD